ncbi:urease accessory protein UreD [Pelagibacterium montanilacus]|uniref:urease accessory protein UreD n=1 Tax=Pelagibacterium montanilacus TaxID=2185280 RepID=UPI000F8C90E6|nr:urease accessory protein UreD [Pelagibacterium montanilacus]
MLDTPNPSAAPAALQRARGDGRVTAKARDGRSVLDTLYQSGCAKIRTPRTHGKAIEAVLINSSGGLTGGDEMAWTAKAGPDAHLVVTTQACERVYRSVGGSAAVANRIEIGPGARVDWLPQETILFEDSALSRRLEVDMAPDAVFFGLEAVILGRKARGEHAERAALRESWRIRRAGTLVHAEEGQLAAGDMLARANRALLDGAGAFATLCYVAPDAERRIGEIKDRTARFATAGASLVGDRIVVRALAPTGYELRKIIVPLVAALSQNGAIPRLWSL